MVRSRVKLSANGKHIPRGRAKWHRQKHLGQALVQRLARLDDVAEEPM